MIEGKSVCDSDDFDYEEYSKMEIKIQQDTLPWIEKYRPTSLEQILSQEDIIKTLRIFMTSKCLPHLLLYGPAGCGKTSTIMAIAKELYGKYTDCMVMELNASNDRGIEIVRNKIKQFVMTKSISFENQGNKNIFKLVILDETDAMTADAQAILRKIIEEYTNNTRFCLICNYINNVTQALQSRCTMFRFSPVTADNIKTKIMEVVKKENIKITDIGINTIVKRSNGDMRKVLNLLQSVNMIYPIINEVNINTCAGYPRKQNMVDILELLIKEPFNECYVRINKIKNENGLSLNDIITEIHNIFIEYITTSIAQTKIIKTLNRKQMLQIISKLREIEYNISANIADSIQLSGLIGIFKKVIEEK